MKLCGMFPHSARKSREGGSRARPFQSPIVGHSACGSTPPTFPRVGAHRACVRPRPGVPKGAEPPLRGLGCPNPSGGRVGIRGHANGRGAGNSGRMKRPCAAEPDRGAGAFHRPCPPPRAGGCCPRTSRNTLNKLHPAQGFSGGASTGGVSRKYSGLQGCFPRCAALSLRSGGAVADL